MLSSRTRVSSYYLYVASDSGAHIILSHSQLPQRAAVKSLGCRRACHTQSESKGRSLLPALAQGSADDIQDTVASLMWMLT